jgi:hypothetical protein
LRHGFGVETEPIFNKGVLVGTSEFVGTFYCGHRSYGTLNYPASYRFQRYEGSFAPFEGKAGEEQEAQGDAKTPHPQGDVPHGQGALVYLNGGTYKGGFVNGVIQVCLFVFFSARFFFFFFFFFQSK